MVPAHGCSRGGASSWMFTGVIGVPVPAHGCSQGDRGGASSWVFTG